MEKHNITFSDKIVGLIKSAAEAENAYKKAIHNLRYYDNRIDYRDVKTNKTKILKSLGVELLKSEPLKEALNITGNYFFWLDGLNYKIVAVNVTFPAYISLSVRYRVGRSWSKHVLKMYPRELETLRNAIDQVVLYNKNLEVDPRSINDNLEQLDDLMIQDLQQ